MTIAPVDCNPVEDLPAFTHAAPIVSEAATPIVAPVQAAASTSRDAKELAFCRSHARVIGGEVEFPCPAGRIDILTESEVIEVKLARNWKHGIGQALVYSSYFPSRQAVLLLLDDGNGTYQALAQHHCDRLGIVLRCESSKVGAA